MKNLNQSLESLMKIQPLDDSYQKPKQTYVAKGGWFGVECSSESITISGDGVSISSKRTIVKKRRIKRGGGKA